MARDLRLFYVFRLFATSYLFVPIAILFLKSRGLGFDRAMLLNTFWCASVLLFDVPTGALADRIGRRRSMMLGAAVMCAACLMFYFAHSFAVFAMASIASGLAMTLTSGADSAYLYDLLNDQGLVHEYPRREGAASAWHLIGSTLAFCFSGIAAEVDLALPYLITAGTSLLALGAAFIMREQRAPARVAVNLAPRELARAYYRHIGTALREIAARRQLRWAIGYSTLVFVLIRVTDYLYPMYLDRAQYDVVTTGFVFAALYLIAALVAHRIDALQKFLPEQRLLIAMPLCLAASFVLLGRFIAPWGVAFMIAPALVNGAYSPLVKSVMNRAIPSSERRATILSFESMSRRIAFGAFSPLIGAVVGAWSIGAGFLLCAGFGALALLGLGAASTEVLASLPQLGQPHHPAAPKPKSVTSPSEERAA